MTAASGAVLGERAEVREGGDRPAGPSRRTRRAWRPGGLVTRAGGASSSAVGPPIERPPVAVRRGSAAHERNAQKRRIRAIQESTVTIVGRPLGPSYGPAHAHW